MDNLTPITRGEILMNDEPLTPITRKEKNLAGEDLNPVTRREYFLKKYRHAGGDVMVEGLEVTANGTYTAPDGKAYSPVEVAVPLAEKSITENGVYNASADSVAGYSKVNVNVPLPENAYLLKTASGSLVSFSDGADLPMPSFICNITANQDLHGYDAPWVGGAGSNKWDEEWENGYLGTSGQFISDDNSICSKNYIPVDPNNTYFGVVPSEKFLRVCAYDSTNTFISYQSVANIAFTLPSNASYIKWSCYNYGTTYNNNIAINYPATVTTYSPYSNICPISGHTGLNAVISPTTEASAGTTIAVSWQTEAGEVFGGYVDLVSGVLTVDKASVNLKDLTWSLNQNTQHAFDSTIADRKQGRILNDQNISNAYKMYDSVTLANYYFGFAFGNNTRIYVKDDRAITVEDIMSIFNAESTVVVYELATPITYQLTPQQIKSLLGNNNAWCDTGEVDADYFAKEV